MSRLRQVLDSLDSEKIKDRTDGLADLKELLSSDKALDAITSAKSWHPLLQKVFRCVVTERNLHLKKPSTAVETRLRSATQTLRWIVERCVTRIGTKTIRPLHTHLLQTSITRRQLYSPVSTEYIKALRVLLEHRQHLEHLDSQEWSETVSFCFAAIFGDSMVLKKDISHLGEDRLEIDELDDEEKINGGEAHLRGRAGQQEADLMACIERLFTSGVAPLVSHASDLLERFARFFRLFPHETTAHLYAVGALNELLKELEFNAVAHVTRAAPTLWTALLDLWMSKLPALREALAIALRLLFPFVKRQEKPESLWAQCWTKLKEDAEVRWKVEDLKLEALSLGERNILEMGPFSTVTFSMGSVFPASQALAWHMLEMAADCVAELFSGSDRVQAVQMTPNREKKRKVDDPLSALLSELEDFSNQSSLHRLQVLVFLIDRHWSILHDLMQRKILDALHHLINRLDTSHTQLQSWVFMAIARLAGLASPQTGPLPLVSPLSSVPWDSLWNMALRRLSLGATCRAACHAAERIMASNKVPHERMLGAVQSLLEQDLLVIGPTYPHDSTCALLTRCLDFAAKDTHLFRLDLGSKVTSWIAAHLAYSPRTTLDVICLLELCTVITSGRRTSSLSRVRVLPAGSLGDFTSYRCETDSMRRFLFDAEIQPSVVIRSASEPKYSSPCSAHDLGVLNLLSRLLKTSTSEAAEGDDKQFWLALSVERTRFILDIAVLILLLHGSLEESGSTPAKLHLNYACEVIQAASVQFEDAHRAASEKWTLFSTFEPLLYPESVTKSIESVICRPGPSSNVPESLLLAMASAKPAASPPIDYLYTVWKYEAVAKAFEKIKGSLMRLLQAEKNGPDFDSDSKGDAMFAERVAPISRSGILLDSDATLLAAFPPFAVRFLLSIAHFRSDEKDASVIDELVDFAQECHVDRAMPIVESIFAGCRQNNVTLSRENADILLGLVGQEWLAFSAASRNVRCQMLGIEALEITMPLWYADDAASGFPYDARHLCGWYAERYTTKTMSSWRLRRRLALFLDAYLVLDPDQAAWEGDSLPNALMPSLNGDADFRVRYCASTSPARLYPLASRHGQRDDHLADAERALFKIYGKFIPRDLDDLETNLTTILWLANTMVAASSQRLDPYNHLRVQAGHQNLYERHIASVFSSVSEQLGFGDRSRLHTYMAVATAQRQSRTKQDIHREKAVSNLVSGFPSRQAATEATFEPVGTVWLAAKDKTAFAAHCRLAGVTIAAGATVCLPAAVAALIGLSFDDELKKDSVAAKESIDAIEHLIKLTSLSKQPWQKVLANSIDQVVAALVAAIWQPDPGREGQYVRSFNGVGRDTAALAYLRLVESGAPKELPRPITQSLTPIGCARALRWLETFASITTHVPTIYGVCQSLLANAGSCLFVHEQLRALYNLCFFLALCGDNVRQPGIQRLVLHGAAVLLASADLSRLCFSIIQYLLNSLLSDNRRQPVPSLSDLLLGIAHTLYQQSQSDLRVATSASVNFNYLESMLQVMLKDGERTDGLHDAASQAVALWPRALPTLDGQESDFGRLKEILESGSLSRGKFALGSAFVKSSIPEGDSLSSVIWRMMAALRLSDEPNLEQSLAFSELLLKSGCRTSPAWKAPISAEELRPVALEIDIQNDIVAKISDLLASTSLANVAKAASVIRTVAALSQEKAFASAAAKRGACCSEINLLAEKQLLRPHAARIMSGKRRLSELKEHAWQIAGIDFRTWIVAFAKLVSEIRFESQPFYGQITSLLDDTLFARQIVPMLVHSLLTFDLAVQGKPAAQTLSLYFSGLLTNKDVDLECIRCIIDIASYLRAYRQASSILASEYKWLPELSWLVLASGAVRCSMHTTALLLLELEHEYIGLQLAETPSTPAAIDARNLLYEIYEHVDEPDGFYGIPNLDPSEAMLRRYAHENKALEMFGAQGARFEASSDDPDVSLALVQSLSHYGLNRLAFAFLEPARSSGVIQDDAIPSQLPFQMAWRSETWTIPVDESSQRSSAASIYAALRAVHRERNAGQITSILREAFSIEVGKLALVDLNSPVPSHMALRAILGLREIHMWHQCLSDPNAGPVAAMTSSSESLSQHLPFEVAEDLWLIRASLFASIGGAEDSMAPIRTKAVSSRHDCLLQLSQTARGANRLQSALNAVSAASLLAVGPDEAADRAAEYARVLWHKGEHELAIEGLSRVLDGLEIIDSTGKVHLKAKAQMLCDLGSWNASARLQSDDDVLETYFQPAEMLADVDPRQYAHVFSSFAHFADARLRAHQAQKEEMQKLEAYQDRKQIELQLMSSTRPSASDQSSASSAGNNTAEQARKQAVDRIELDRARLERFHSAGAAALALATRLYTRVLITSDSSDEVVFRLVALWLENHADQHFNDEFASALALVPSRKFVVLAHQLSARLSKLTDSATSFRHSLSNMVGRLCREHPFHILYHIYALRPLDAVSEPPVAVPPKTRRSLGLDTPSASQAGRHRVAADYFAHTKADKGLQTRVSQLEMACAAYVEVAHLGRLESKKASIELPSSLKLLKLRNLDIPVSTYDLPIDLTMVYDRNNLPCIARYERRAQSMSGINQPKAIWCVSTQATRLRQLCKGGDDVRQDAVMQQVFGVVNHFLASDTITRRRQLLIRRYKVIPLIGATGLLEFVPNTRPLGGILEPLHKNYRPKDLDFKKARDMMKDSFKKGTEARVKAFKDILSRISPVFRHHFRDRRTLATPWFEMRLAYQRSVAATSIVGWMLGIGDRHVSNLLFDDSTGEIVPIDFGIAFDAGELLPIPELVPFRLTRDIIDGLGLTGTSGVFRRCSEETLRVLREQMSTIMSVLEVLKYDPLQRWTLTTGKAQKAQDAPLSNRAEPYIPSDDADVPADAARALAGVAAKLSNSMSVQQRITELIRQATSPENLATIFWGWQSYL